MSQKLGELLIKEKMITPEQLEVALKVHQTYGVKLGSCLVELGYVSEEPLAQLLSEKLGVPRVGHKHVSNASWEATSKLSRELAAKYRVIPFHLEGNRLCIAMSEPSDFQAIEEIGFITGCVVKPYIAPDVVISKALAKFYQITSDAGRYYQVEEYGNGLNVQEVPQTVTFQMTSETGELVDVTVPAEFEGFDSLETMPDSPGLPVPPPHGALDFRQDEERMARKEFAAMFNILERKGLITRDEMMDELRKLNMED